MFRQHGFLFDRILRLQFDVSLLYNKQSHIHDGGDSVHRTTRSQNFCPSRLCSLSYKDRIRHARLPSPRTAPRNGSGAGPVLVLIPVGQERGTGRRVLCSPRQQKDLLPPYCVLARSGAPPWLVELCVTPRFLVRTQALPYRKRAAAKHGNAFLPDFQGAAPAAWVFESSVVAGLAT